MYGLQFHPEVDLTVNGIRIIKNFLYEVPVKIRSTDKYMSTVYNFSLANFLSQKLPNWLFFVFAK